MFKLACLFAFVAAVSAGNLAVAPVVAAAVPAPIVTARSSQSIARNYNTLVSAPLTYTATAAVAAPLTYAAAPAAAFPAKFAYAAPGFAAPLTYAAPAAVAAPLAYTAPVAHVSPYAAAAPLILKK
ncbi:cuticle protein 12.5-like [Diprion similis]|uniref:cuticle protein 12.5-like n=1 Tax=Diprion similis TaxID=362088 RepID=UPI001EF9227B|nr:cuticle protein 12.5-like [Diprion similis]